MDAETREVLHETLELLKLQMIYTRNLHDSFSALHDAVMRVDPRLKQFDEEEMLKIRTGGPTEHTLSLLEALLQRLDAGRLQ